MVSRMNRSVNRTEQDDEDDEDDQYSDSDDDSWAYYDDSAEIEQSISEAVRIVNDGLPGTPVQVSVSNRHISPPGAPLRRTAHVQWSGLAPRNLRRRTHAPNYADDFDAASDMSVDHGINEQIARAIYAEQQMLDRLSNRTSSLGQSLFFQEGVQEDDSEVLRSGFTRVPNQRNAAATAAEVRMRAQRLAAPRASADVTRKTLPSLLCPITQEPFQDPVQAADGHVYERSAIEQWFEEKRTSPMTGERIGTKLLDAHTVRKLCEEWTSSVGAASR